MPDQVRAGVTNDLKTFFITRGDDADSRIMINGISGINQRAIDLAGYRCLGQTRANGFSDLHDRDGVIETALASIWKGNGGHGISLRFSGAPYQSAHDV